MALDLQMGVTEVGLPSCQFSAYYALLISTKGHVHDQQTDGQTDNGCQWIMPPAYGDGGIKIKILNVKQFTGFVISGDHKSVEDFENIGQQRKNSWWNNRKQWDNGQGTSQQCYTVRFTLCLSQKHTSYELKGSVKEPNKFHIYETEKISPKASDAAEYIELFGSSTRDRYARRINVILWTSANICVVVHDDLGWKNRTTWYILLHHWRYEWFSSAENVRRYMRRAWWSRVKELNNT